jgi:hypothetical protein
MNDRNYANNNNNNKDNEQLIKFLLNKFLNTQDNINFYNFYNTDSDSQERIFEEISRNNKPKNPDFNREVFDNNKKESIRYERNDLIKQFLITKKLERSIEDKFMVNSADEELIDLIQKQVTQLQKFLYFIQQNPSKNYKEYDCLESLLKDVDTAYIKSNGDNNNNNNL